MRGIDLNFGAMVAIKCKGNFAIQIKFRIVLNWNFAIQKKFRIVLNFRNEKEKQCFAHRKMTNIYPV